MTAEEFATNLIQVFSDQNKSPVTYVTVGVLINSIQAALVPRDTAGRQEFPKMLSRQDKRSGKDETLLIGNAEEQQLAEAQGWRTTATPKPSYTPVQPKIAKAGK